MCVAQYNSISLMAPLFFLIVSFSLAAISYVSIGSAPVFLTIVVPLMLLVGDLIVFNAFMIPRSDNSITYQKLILSRLHVAVWGIIAMGLARISWAISLMTFADREIQELIVAFLATSTIGASLCLLHLRAASLAFITIIMVPLAVFLWLNDVGVFGILALILALITAVVVFVANRYGNDFSRMIMQQQEVEIKRAEAEHLSRLNLSIANQDSLTGLANRRAFMAHLQDLVQNGRASNDEGLAVGILDLDGFKQINDVYGHMAGDRLLQEASKRLTSLLFGKVFVARMGGDEFGIIVSDARCDNKLVTLGERICRAMQMPYKIGGFSASLGGSLGFARWNSEKDSGDELFEKADYALYHAKSNLRGGVMVFNEQHAATIKKTSNVDRRLQNANLEDEMSLVFQPIVVSENANAIGFEALARWRSPILGSVSPDIFIGAAERLGIINRLSGVLLKKALHEASRWPKNFHLSFNLSMQDITSAEMMLQLVSIIKSSGVDPKRITFEVTETSIMNDCERAMESLNFLKNLGAKIALDDFGTGYSSLAYIRDLPLDKLKLDRGFISGVDGEKSSAAIVQAMINMCWNLEIDCVVEGVETASQFKALGAMGCNIFQGYYFSKPLEKDDALAYALTQRAVEEVAEGNFYTL